MVSNGVTYDQFLKSSFIAAFDLTTNNQPGLAWAINTVRTGNFMKSNKKFFHRNNNFTQICTSFYDS